MAFLLAKIAVLLLIATLLGAWLQRWWTRRRHLDVTTEYQQLTADWRTWRQEVNAKLQPPEPVNLAPIEQRLAVGQPRMRGRDLLPFAGQHRKAVELGGLPFELFARQGQRAGVLLGSDQLLFDLAPRFPGVRDAQALRLVACVRIEHVALALGAQKALVCVLTVDVDKMIADFPKLGCVDGRSIDVCPAAPLRIDHAPQDQRIFGA